MEVLTALIWVVVPCIAAFVGFKLWLDRMHPRQVPDPDGAELLKRVEEFEKKIEKDLEALSGRIAFRERPRLRE